MLNDVLLPGNFLDDIPLGAALDDRSERLTRFVANDLGVDAVSLLRVFEQCVPGQAMPGWWRERENVFALANASE